VVTDPSATAADTQVDGDPFAEDLGVDIDEHSELPDPPPCQRRPFNQQGMGGNQNHHNQHYVRHFQRDCPSKKSYIATDDGGYVSASDVEDDFALQTNNVGELDDDDAEVFRSEHTEEYNTKTYVVQRVLSAQVDTSEKLQCHNLFQIFFVIKDCRVRTIIDGGCCNNLVSADFVAKISLTTHLHTHPYYIQWLINNGKAKVTDIARVHFSIGTTYHDYADCDVVPMQACSLLLGHPWEFDTDAIHYGRSNKYTLMHN
jgi:hypothetical protein